MSDTSTLPGDSQRTTPQVVSIDDTSRSVVENTVNGTIPPKRKLSVLDPERNTEQGSDENADDEEIRKKRKTDRVILQAFERAFLEKMEDQSLPVSPSSSGLNRMAETASMGTQSQCLTSSPATYTSEEFSKSEEVPPYRPAMYIGSQRPAETPPQITRVRNSVMSTPAQIPPTPSGPSSPVGQTSAADTVQRSGSALQANAIAQPSSQPFSRPPSQAPSRPSSRPTSRPPSRAPSSNPSTNPHYLPPVSQAGSSFATTYRSPFEPTQHFLGTPLAAAVIPTPVHSHISTGAQPQGQLNGNTNIAQGHPQHPQPSFGGAPLYMNQQQHITISNQALLNVQPPGVRLPYPQSTLPPVQPRPMTSPMNASEHCILPHPSFFQALTLELSPMSSTTNPTGTAANPGRRSVPLTQTKAAVKEEWAAVQTNPTAGGVQRSPHPLQTAPNAVASSPSQLQNDPGPTRQQSRSIEAAADMLMNLLDEAVNSASSVTEQQKTEDNVWLAAHLKEKETELETERAERKKEHTVWEEEKARGLEQIRLLEHKISYHLQRESQFDEEREEWKRDMLEKEKGRYAEEVDVAKKKLIQRETELEEERAHWKKDRDEWEEEKARYAEEADLAKKKLMHGESVFGEERAQWEKERDVWEEERARISEEVDFANKALIQREAELEEERIQRGKERNVLEEEKGRQLEQIDLAKQEISQLLEKVTKFEEERTQWEKLREALEGEKANISKQINLIHLQIPQLLEKKIGEERAQWKKEREAWEAVKTRIGQHISQDKQQISQLLTKEKKFEEERDGWEKERARRIEETSRLLHYVKTLSSAGVRHSPVAGQANGVEAKKGVAEPSQQRQGPVPATSTQKPAGRPPAQDDLSARINATAIQRTAAMQEATKRLTEQNPDLSAKVPAAQNSAQQTRIAGLERTLAGHTAGGVGLWPGVAGGAPLQKTQPSAPNAPVRATEK